MINKLKEDGHEIIIITARWPEPGGCSKVTTEWLEKYNIKYDEIIFDSANKGKVTLDKKIDLFIDDSFINCQEVGKAGIKTFMIETRTNKGLTIDNVTRVYSWSDI